MKKPRKLWRVWGRNCDGFDIFLGETRAVSEQQACNQVRRRCYDETPYAEIPLMFWASEVVVRKPRSKQQQLMLL